METKDLLLKSIKEGDVNQAISLVNSEPCLLEEVYEPGISLILLAAYHHQKPLVDYLLDKVSYLNVFEASAVGNAAELERNLRENPAQVNAFSADGFQPLGLACYFGHTDLARRLVDAGADINQVSKNGMALQPIHSAAASGDMELVSYLVSKGADVNSMQSSGATPLHTAAFTGNADLAKFLLGQGAEPFMKTREGKTPLDLAVEKGHHHIAELLWEIESEE